MGLTLEGVKNILTTYFTDNGYSPLTLSRSHWMAIWFNRYITAHEGIEDFRDVTESHALGYCSYLQTTLSKASSRRTYMSYIKKVFSILEEEEKILINPFHIVPKGKKVVSVKDKVLSQDEIKRLLAYPRTDTAVGFRNRTMLEVLYGTGIRCAELIQLKLKDIVREDNFLYIREGKGRKDRIVPLGTVTGSYLFTYLSKIRKHFTGRSRSTVVFLRSGGHCFKPCHVSYMIRFIARKQEIGHQVTPHMFRHSFATHLLENGARLTDIQRLLGHSCLDSTQIYITLHARYLEKVYTDNHPFENELYFDVEGRELEELKQGLPNSHIKVKKKLTNS